MASLVVVNFLLRVLGRYVTAGWPLRRWLATTRRLGRRGPRVAPVPSIWSGALPAVRRAECREGARLGVSIDTRLALGASSEAPERAGMATTISQRRPCGLGRHVPPQAPIPAAGGAVPASETRCSRPRDIGTRRRCPTHSGERPTRHGHARLARRSTLGMVWLVTTPSLEPKCPTSVRRSSRAPWASLGGPPAWLRLLEFVPSPQEGEFGILEAATGSPATGSGRRWGHAGLSATAG